MYKAMDEKLQKPKSGLLNALKEKIWEKRDFSEIMEIIPTKIINTPFKEQLLQHRADLLDFQQLKPYYIGKYEVSYQLWQQVYNWAKDHGYSLKHKVQKGEKFPDNFQPVTSVDWLSCIVWCNAYTEMKGNPDQCVYLDSRGNIIKSTQNLTPEQIHYDKTKKGYRLPTEAEWEYAAVSTQVNKQSENHSNLNYNMKSNIWEWCYDSWQNLQAKNKMSLPLSIRESERVVYSSSWFTGSKECAISYRGSWHFRNTASYLGLRIVYSQ